LLVSAEEGAATISSVLLGWALAIAVGLPLISLTAPQIGWDATYALIGGLAVISCVALLAGLPKGLKGALVIFATWRAVGRSRALMLLLLITTLLATGQYIVIAFARPLLIRLTNATPGRIAAVFALFGAMTRAGNLCASRVVRQWGAKFVGLPQPFPRLA
jgi:DHA1 family inner membrane transport protein